MNRIAARWPFIAVALVGGGLDLLTKSLAFGFLGADARSPASIGGVPEKSLIPGFFSLEAALNPGSLWGMFGNYSGALTVITSCIFIVLVLLAMSRKSEPLPMQMALGLFCAGAIGNLADRIIYRGYVRDFLLFYVGSWEWPNFNLADSCICAGAGVFLWAEWRRGRELAAAAGAGGGAVEPGSAGTAVEKVEPGPAGGAGE